MAKKNKDPTPVIPYTEKMEDGTEVFVYGKIGSLSPSILQTLAKP